MSRVGLDYQDWGVEVFWQPSSDDVGKQPFCFSATDSEGYVAEKFPRLNDCAVKVQFWALHLKKPDGQK